MGRNDIKRLYNHADSKNYAIGHFNFSTLEILHAILRAAKKTKSPVIVATSEGEESFVGSEEAVAITEALKDRLNGKLILHADHHKTFATAKKSIQAGYPSVHIDASKNKFGKNVSITKKVVELAHKNDVWVEGELGHVGGSSTLHEEDISKAADPKLLTDPEQARDFVEKTGVDALAVNIGNAHGVWKGKPKLDFERLEEIKKKTKKPLVLHGGSGIDTKSFRRAIKLGIDKVNINSDMRIAYAKAITESMKTREDYTPYNYMEGPIKAVQKIVEDKMRIFKSNGML